MTLTPLVASLLTQVWIARALGRVGLGEYHATSLFVTVITTVLFFGFPTAAAQRIAALDEARDQRARSTIDTALALALGLGAGVAIVGIVSWPFFTVLFDLHTEFPIEFIGAAVFAAAVGMVAGNVLLAMLRLGLTTVVIIAQPAGVGVAILGYHAGLPIGGTELALAGFLAGGLVGAVILLLQGARPRPDLSEAPELLHGSLAATAWTYPSLVTGWLDRAIVGTILGPAALGAFVAASTLVEALLRLTRGITTLGVPAYARLAADRVGAGRVVDSHLRLMAATFIIAGAVFIAAGSGLLSVVFGEGFAIARTTLRLLAIAALPLGLAVVLASVTVGSGPVRGTARILVLLIPAHLILSAVATTLFHIAGTALANLVLWLIGAVFYLREARRRNAPVRSRTLLHIAGVAAPIFSASWIVGLSDLAWPISGLIAFAGSMIVVTVLLVGSPERRLLRRVMFGEPTSDPLA